MTQDEFEKLVEQGIELIPEEIRKKMENVEIVVENFPNPEQLRRAGVPAGSSLFGLYQGVPKSKRGSYYANVLPDKITLFQRVIESHYRTPEAIKERVKRTVWHEIAHHFGFNEQAVRDLEKRGLNKMFKFEIQKKSKKSRARLGIIKTPHGSIKTPAFIPVATLGVLKGGLSQNEVEQAKTQCQITNSFHFLDLDRVEQVGKTGGLHKFFNFDKPIFTDSGGFQVFSFGKGKEFGLGKIGSIFPDEKSAENTSRQKENSVLHKKGENLLKISQRGARFRSPRDGREILLTPELSFKIQKQLGADFIYLLDVCGSPMDSREEAEKEMEISHQWFKRFLKTASNSGVGGVRDSQQIFGIIQGGVYKDLRQISTKFVNDLPVFGIAIGGALGKSKKEMYEIISVVNEDIDWQRPHHLLGIGDLEVMENIVKLGIDLFDCALPTRIARHGTAMTNKGSLNLCSGRYKDSFEPIEKGCKCPVCQNWTKAQLNFLFKAKEQIAGKLLTIHNLFFIETYLEKIRKKIAQGEL